MTFAVALTSGAHATTPLGLRIDDPSHHVAAYVTGAEVVRSSVRLEKGTAGGEDVYFKLTRRGERAFHLLTAGLAKRGAAEHKLEPFAVKVNGTTYAQPLVDFRATPHGLSAASGVLLGHLAASDARQLVQIMRSQGAR